MTSAHSSWMQNEVWSFILFQVVDGVDNGVLFDDELLKKINWDESKIIFNPKISPMTPGSNFVIRSLASSDYDKGLFMKIISWFTKKCNLTLLKCTIRFQIKDFLQYWETWQNSEKLAEKIFLVTIHTRMFEDTTTKWQEIKQEQFVIRLDAFQKMKSCKGMYYVTVVEDTSISKIVGSATLLIEQKFIHSCALVNITMMAHDWVIVINDKDFPTYYFFPPSERTYRGRRRQW